MLLILINMRKEKKNVFHQTRRAGSSCPAPSVELRTEAG